MVKKVVFDFDGTLIRVNSFPKWVKFLLLKKLKNFEFLGFLQLSYFIFLRKILNKISHDDFKQKLILHYSDSKLCAEFAEKLTHELNQNVFEILKKHVQNNDLIAISSAAPEVYLHAFFDIIMDEKLWIVGSQIHENKLIINHKDSKIHNLEIHNFINKNENFDCLYTDSLDDSSLANRAEKIILVNPNVESKSFYLKNFSDKTELIDQT